MRAYQSETQAKGLDPFAPQIQEMVQQQFIGTRIFAELTKLGYTGSLTSLYRYLGQFQAEGRTKATIRFVQSHRDDTRTILKIEKEIV